MSIHYLEIVASDVDAVCSAYAVSNGLTFGEPQAELGNARTAEADGGMLVGVRAPMHGGEAPTVRPYWLVDDIEAAVTAATGAGADVAVPPMDIPGRGQCALYIMDGVQHGLWQL